MVAGLLIIHSKSCFLLYLCYLFLFFFFFSFLSVYCYQPISLHPHAQVLSNVTPWTVAHQAPLSMGFSRQEYWSGLPFPSPYLFIFECRYIICLVSVSFFSRKDGRVNNTLSGLSKIIIYKFKQKRQWKIFCCFAVTQWCLTLCDPWTAVGQPPLSLTLS